MDPLLLSSHAGAVDPVGAVTGFWDAHGHNVQTLLKFGMGIVVYGLLVNAFYQVISKRVMFAGKQVDGRTRVGGPGRGFVYLMLFPLVSFLFFLLLTAALLFLSANEHGTAQLVTLSMSLVLAVRVSAYFSEATSHDIAKMLPLGLLGVALVRAEFQGLVESFEAMLGIFDHLSLVALYFVVVVVTEYVLRSVYLLVSASKSRPARRTKDAT